jgi:hypothetical protein
MPTGRWFSMVLYGYGGIYALWSGEFEFLNAPVFPPRGGEERP